MDIGRARRSRGASYFRARRGRRGGGVDERSGSAGAADPPGGRVPAGLPRGSPRRARSRRACSRMWLTWTFTVPSATSSDEPISLLDLPAATSRRTSSSRGVRLGAVIRSASLMAARGGSTSGRSRRRGGRRAGPPGRSRLWARSRGPPRARASCTSSSVPNAEKTTTCTPGHFSRSVAIPSAGSMPGMCRSRTAISGLDSRACSTASGQVRLRRRRACPARG